MATGKKWQKWRWRRDKMLSKALTKGGLVACVCGRALASKRGTVWLRQPNGAPWKKRYLCTACHAALLAEVEQLERLDRSDLPVERLVD